MMSILNIRQSRINRARKWISKKVKLAAKPVSSRQTNNWSPCHRSTRGLRKSKKIKLRKMAIRPHQIQKTEPRISVTFDKNFIYDQEDFSGMHHFHDIDGQRPT